jgi:hypothetical protein
VQHDNLIGCTGCVTRSGAVAWRMRPQPDTDFRRAFVNNDDVYNNFHITNLRPQPLSAALNIIKVVIHLFNSQIS